MPRATSPEMLTSFSASPTIRALRPRIEVKRIKVSGAAFKTGRPNKLHEYDKAVKQANRLAQVGFAQVYLYVIVVVDSRENNEGRYTYNGLTAELRAKIEAIFSLEQLESRIGLVRHEFVQSMDHPPLELGTYSGHLIRLAQEVPPVGGSHGVDSWACRLERSLNLLLNRRAASRCFIRTKKPICSVFSPYGAKTQPVIFGGRK